MLRITCCDIRHFLLIVMFPLSSPLFAAEAAKVEFVWGTAFAISASGEKNELTKGSNIQVGDTVVSEDARLQLRFTDGGFVSLAPHSEFRVNAYSYSGQPDGTEHISMELLKGGLRTIDGLIGKAVQAAYELKTTVATMGIRGTEYTVVYGEGVSGTVSAGAIAVCNAGGCIDVARGQSYFVADIQTKPVYISKAAFLSPPQPAKVDQKKMARAETPGRDSLNKEHATSGRGNTKLSHSRDDGRWNHEIGPQSPKGLDDSRDGNGSQVLKGNEKTLLQRFDSALQDATIEQKRPPEILTDAVPMLDSKNGSGKTLDSRDGGGKRNDVERSLNTTNLLKQLNDNILDGTAMRKGKQSPK
jgi:hypothetical protein